MQTISAERTGMVGKEVEDYVKLEYGASDLLYAMHSIVTSARRNGGILARLGRVKVRDEAADNCEIYDCPQSADVSHHGSCREKEAVCNCQ